MKYANNINGVITVFNSLPTEWKTNYGNTIIGFNYSTELVQQANGFYELVTQTLGTNQYLGLIYFDTPNNYFTYYVEDMTEAQIQAKLTSENETEKQVLIQKDLETQVILSAQQLDDTQDELNNQALYPFWDESGIPYVIGQKTQAFDGADLFLYKCVQDHNSQSDWTPSATPSLWTKVAKDGEIPVWLQPTGAQDAYQIGNRVYFPTETDSVYECIIADNVWSPSVYTSGWLLEESEAPEPTVSDWVQPTSSNPYMIGDQVLFNGSIYESIIDNNVWSPTAYPVGWEIQ